MVFFLHNESHRHLFWASAALVTLLVLPEALSFHLVKFPKSTSRQFPTHSFAVKSDSTVLDLPNPEATTKQATDSTEAISGSSSIVKSSSSEIAVLVCPAQFCVPEDYDILFDNLKSFTEDVENNDDRKMMGIPNIGTCRVAPLPRTEWIKVARNLPTQDFLDAKLPVHSTLGWYFDAIETALADIFAEKGPNVKVCIVGHSIGGWVARAYLGGLSRSSSAVSKMALRQCTSLITLGTPHISPETALVDQTRGLLREIAEAPSCSSQALSDNGVDVTCVCSSGLSGSFLTLDVEEIVAASSYLPLLGMSDKTVKGDGIVPLELAFMEEPARRLVIDKCSITGAPVRHSHVLPTPWNLVDGYAPSIVLPEDFVSYVSDGVLSEWIKYIR